MDNPSPAHEMVITETHEGTEEWRCPVCGRVLLIEWEPWSKITVVEGDLYAAHTGSKGGLKMGVQVRQ